MNESPNINAHCVLLREAFRARSVPAALTRYQSGSRLHWLGGYQLTEVLYYDVPLNELVTLAPVICDSLEPREYYAHAIVGDQLYIFYPDRVFQVSRGDDAGLSRAQDHGRLLGIPLQQMPFGRLFETDHPTEHKGPDVLDRREFFAPTRSSDSTYACVCGRVIALEGLRATILADGQLIAANMPNVQGLRKGDIVGLRGHLASTIGPASAVIEVELWTVLTLNLAANPDVTAGREKAIVDDQSLRQALLMRSRVLRLVRDFLALRGFIEIDTPILLPRRDVAPIEHFQVMPSSDGCDVLRICPENYLKRLVVAGFDRVFEIGHCFRVETAASGRLCEFTTLESYQAYASYRDVLAMFAELVTYVVRAVNHGDPTLETAQGRFDLSQPWREVDYRDAVLERTGIDVDEHRSRDELREALVKHGIEMPPTASRRECFNKLADVVERAFVGPTILRHHPFETICVAKRLGHTDKLERFEAFVGPLEIAHAFSELTDVIEQRRRMSLQQIENSEAASQGLDEEFLDALTFGLPPTGGLGLGIDRLLMLLTKQPIERVVAFPRVLSPSAVSQGAQHECAMAS